MSIWIVVNIQLQSSLLIFESLSPLCSMVKPIRGKVVTQTSEMDLSVISHIPRITDSKNDSVGENLQTAQDHTTDFVNGMVGSESCRVRTK